ncbi:Mo-dependent nitrogenase family protein [Crinalium epipsammum PCC 9333]|uniref:Mo-dependent nitrogenase family protein n=1 Tax=Crinalium epipsammum PCC 9333 TaxID=1173022 RepID=K9VX99_9CYAN|nr:Mo-dependent nitrogenase C-terminal domain-containing protein [Crinalium epipsammum]AFZ12127.1 Mo-dependent nitrogenase family protein [Crinalium epipsammum PCC 9333]
MTSVIQSPYSSEQITIWLRGLLTVAWIDGDFDEEEQKLIASLTQKEIDPKIDLSSVEPITAEELAAAFANDSEGAENFLRTAVLVALADGIYSYLEDKLLYKFAQALGKEAIALEALRHTLYEHPETEPDQRSTTLNISELSAQGQRALLQPVRHWLDGLEIHDPRVARFLGKLIPSQCPFERDIELFGHKIVHIPPLCKLNPLYEQLVSLRFRALSYLADDCGEDVSQYF